MTLLIMPIGTTFAAPSAPIVSVTGGKVQGIGTDEGVLSYRGIPYAADTSGSNRFRAPQPAVAWTGVLDASAYGPICPGFGGLPPPGAIEAPEGNDPNLTAPSEDCLRLNVWTPAADAGKRAVIVYLHGGGFVTGSGNISWYDGSNLAKNQDVVFVSINYRLNIFGFLYLGGIDPTYAQDGNAGLQDIVAALGWVHDNIAQFGGDPANVTVMGQSAGAQAAVTLMGIPAAKGLFSRVIADSPSSDLPASAEQATGQAHGALEQLGVSADLSKLGDLPWDKVIGAFTGNGPVVDGTFMPTGLTLADAAAMSPDVTLLIGWNATENTFFEGPEVIADGQTMDAALTKKLGSGAARLQTLIDAYHRAFPAITENELYFRISADLDFGKSVLDTAKAKAALNKAPVYVYQFAGRTTVRNLMTPHTLELGYVLDNLAMTKALSGLPTKPMQSLATSTSAAWAAFAKTGIPSLPEWTPFDPGLPSVMRIGDTPSMAPLSAATSIAVDWTGH
ncbi:carboxylesterase family protein [Devosia sp.]|uniref:carboxylesterase/lipase family protein n=1 Tax=Devosia sp. TaxID=1871048 RepID=UPI003262EAF5